ncbi:MAG: hypothetical protein UY99_C0038G0012 [Parcubacteria group bacterium GW2011_GWA1_59_11]|nr:MAG: hypothetical protein UY99_C0038G0012 [Parcubacteria group bacterium GW2011_GWA1_59_11]
MGYDPYPAARSRFHREVVEVVAVVKDEGRYMGPAYDP